MPKEVYDELMNLTRTFCAERSVSLAFRIEVGALTGYPEVRAVSQLKHLRSTGKSDFELSARGLLTRHWSRRAREPVYETDYDGCYQDMLNENQSAYDKAMADDGLSGEEKKVQ
ncbi:hypothetical protein IAR50_007335 [Cryptococcus sp. DSM 104548]